MQSVTDNGAIKGLDAREDGVYITYVPTDGADAVVKKLGNATLKRVAIANTRGITQNQIPIDCNGIDGIATIILTGTWVYGGSGYGLILPDDSTLLYKTGIDGDVSGVGTQFAYMQTVIFLVDVTDQHQIIVTCTGNRVVQGVSYTILGSESDLDIILASTK